MDTNEQRRHPRFPERLSVDVHVFVLPATDVEAGYEASGKTVNIGRGGVLIRLDRGVREGSKVRLRFWELPPGVRLWPMLISGSIRRMEPGQAPGLDEDIGPGSLLAVEFSEPLERLDVPPEAAEGGSSA